jgi:hypothetical protein
MSTKNYVIQGVKGFTDTIFYKAMKTRYKLFPVFKRENPNFPNDLMSDMEDFWDSIEELTPIEMFGEDNLERRRVLFSYYGPENIAKNFKLLEVAKETIKKNNVKVVDGKEISYTFEDTYTLYKVTDPLFLDKINEGCHNWNKIEVFMVHCKCTTTGRDYYIYVPENVAYDKDPIKCIAWTIMVQVASDSIEEIYRHGDVVIVKTNDKYNKESWVNYNRHLTKEEYLTKLKIES